MKNPIILLIVVTTVFNCFGQTNLVQNPSFEIYSTCPEWPDQVANATGWTGCKASPDYFNSCYTGPGNGQSFSVPSNFAGFQQAASGQAYVGLGTYYSWDYREYIGQELNAPLVTGTKYFCSMKVSPGFNPAQNIVLATDKLGLNFSTTIYSPTNPAFITNDAKVYTQTIISDTANWTMIFGSFIADSSYNYIMLGNFFESAQTNLITLASSSFPGALYFIDDVCVSTDSLFALNYEYENVGFGELGLDSGISISPNPSTSIITVSTTGNYIEEIIIYSSNGNTIYFETSIGQQRTIDLSKEPKGVYFLRITDSNYMVTYKKIILQ